MATYRKVLPVYSASTGTLEGFSASGRAIEPKTAPTATPGIYRRFVKRAFDLLLVILAAPVVLPWWGARAPGGQRRRQAVLPTGTGRGGRSHLPHVEAAHDGARREGRARRSPGPGRGRADQWETTQKLKNDPRITRVGQFLRRSSLDELPQLWNVFKGDISLVGPRPMMPEQQILYPGDSYYRLRPGITGPWQVSARNLSTFADRARFDVHYDLNLSLPTDLRILLLHRRVILKATGH